MSAVSMYCVVNSSPTPPQGIATVRPRVRQCTTAVMSDADMAEQIVEAQSEIDATLATRYPVPFPGYSDTPTPTPTLISVITANLTVVNVLNITQSGDASGKELALSQRLRVRVDYLLAQLKAGSIFIPGYPQIARVATTSSTPCYDINRARNFNLYDDPHRFNAFSPGYGNPYPPTVNTAPFFSYSDDQVDQFLSGFWSLV